MRKVAHCDECGKEWLPVEYPKQCSKCKSRRWNSSGVSDGAELDVHSGSGQFGNGTGGVEEVVSEAVDLGEDCISGSGEAPSEVSSEIHRLVPDERCWCGHGVYEWKDPQTLVTRWKCDGKGHFSTPKVRSK